MWGMTVVKRDRVVFSVLALGAIDLGLEQFMVLPILPAVQRETGASLTATAWIVTGFLLAAVAAAPIVGRLGDLYGRRRLLLLSVGAFALGSLVCAVSGSVEGLIVGRVLQGLGAGLGPLAIGIARVQAPRGRAQVWIGLLIGISGVGAAFGLLVGGALVEYVSVASVFWCLLALAVFLFAVALLVPETPPQRVAEADWRGGLALTGALVTALVAISQGNSWGWGSARVIGLFVASVAMLAVFVQVERAAASPLVDMRLFERRSAWSANLVAFSMGFALFISGVVLPQIAVLPEASGYGFGLTYAQTGVMLAPGALSIVVGAAVSGSLVRRTGARTLIACGALAGALGYTVLAVEHESLDVVVLANCVLGLGIGLSFAAITNLVVSSVDEERTSVFAATTAVSRSIGAALGAQVAAAVIVAGGVDSGFPNERGFTHAFVLGALATLVALTATLAIPGRAADPLLERPRPAAHTRRA
jgi:MFS family permease